MNLTEGEMYKLTTMISGVQRYARVHVMKYIGRGGYSGKDYVFSARPVAGTQEIPVTHIINAWRVSSDTKPYMNRRA